MTADWLVKTCSHCLREGQNLMGREAVGQVEGGTESGKRTRCGTSRLERSEKGGGWRKEPKRWTRKVEGARELKWRT